MSSQRVAVVGGSVAGVSAALFLARRGHHVVVLERDAAPSPPTVDEAGPWRRRSTPQAAHSHAFLARSRMILNHEAPDVLADMLDQGVRQAMLIEDRPPASAPTDVGAAGGLDGTDDQGITDADLIVLNARRSVFEWVLRRAAEHQPGVEFRAGVTVNGLETHQNGSTRVVGVTTEAGPVAADVVVDAGGKRSPIRGWIGADTSGDLEVPCGISYITRFYQLRHGEPARLNRGFTHGASFDRYSCLVFPADNGAFSVTFGVLPEDKDMRSLLDPAAFDAAAASIPTIASWVDPDVAVPTSDVALMASLRNLLRAPVTEEPLGLHTIGDARCVTNPAHTRGTTLALLGAQRLAQVVTDLAGDPAGQAEAMAAFTDRELAAWFDDSVAQDAARLSRWRPHEEPHQPAWVAPVSNGEAYLASQRDRQAWQAFTRLQNTLALPSQVLGGATLAAAVDRVARSGWRPAPVQAPNHDELVALARAAGANAARS